jgi:hypothetical protein
MPILRSRSELASHHDTVVTIAGTYRAMDLARHRCLFTRSDGSIGSSSVIAAIELDGGIHVDIYVRPDDELAAMKGKRVTVVGRLDARPSVKEDISSMSSEARLYDVISVELDAD